MKKSILLLATAVSTALFMSSCGSSNSPTEEELQAEIEAMFGNLEEELEEDAGVFISEDGKFEIDFMGENPSPQSSNVPTDIGDIEMVMFMYEKSATEAYMVAYSDYPTEFVSEDGAQNLLGGAKEGALGNMGISSTDYENEIEVNGRPGLEFAGNNGDVYVTYKIALSNNRLYQVAILRQGSYASDENKERFIESFKITKEKV